VAYFKNRSIALMRNAEASLVERLFKEAGEIEET
jgi:hypothetical protein